MVTVSVRSLVVLALGVSLVACSDAKAANTKNFERAIRASFATTDSRMCTTPYTLPAATSDRGLYSSSSSNPAYNALAHVGLVKVVQSKVHHPAAFFTSAYDEHMSTYSLTPMGQKYATASKDSFSGNTREKFCYAGKVVERVTNFTEPGDAGGMKISEARYTYALQNVAPWARGAQIQAAIPEIGQTLQGEHAREESATLTLTNNGWEVSR